MASGEDQVSSTEDYILQYFKPFTTKGYVPQLEAQDPSQACLYVSRAGLSSLWAVDKQ